MSVSRRYRKGLTRVLCGALAFCLPSWAGSALSVEIPENTWVQVTPTVNLPTGVTGRFDERIYTKMVYSPLTQTFISWDGFVDDGSYPTTIYSNAVWSYSAATNTLSLDKLNSWHNVGGSSYTTVSLAANATDPTPADRHQYGVMAYVPERKAVYIWGGANRTLPGGHPTDTWAFNLETKSWQDLTPSWHPPMTLEAAAAYDTFAKKLVMFGGDQGGSGRTYLYDVLTNVWSEVAANGVQPSWRMGHAMVYDPIRRVTLLFGGGPWPDSGNELWAFDTATNSWTQLTPAISPPPRKFHAFAYDSRNDVVLLYGGRNGEGGGAYNDTWVYVPASGRWVKLAPTTSPTAPAYWVDMDYDPVQNVFVARIDGTWWLYRYSNTAATDPRPSPPRNVTIR